MDDINQGYWLFNLGFFWCYYQECFCPLLGELSILFDFFDYIFLKKNPHERFF